MDGGTRTGFLTLTPLSMDYKKLLSFVFLFNLAAVHAQSKLKFTVNTIHDGPYPELTGILFLNGKLASEEISFNRAYQFEVQFPMHLILSFPGFERIDTVFHDNLMIHNHNFLMQPRANTLKEVEVNGKKLQGKMWMGVAEDMTLTASKKSQIIRPYESGFNDAQITSRHLFSEVSGLNIQENNDLGMQLNIGGRGLDPNRSSNFNIRQNGYDISADVLGYPESYYTPPAQSLESIRIIRGSASLQYGTQFGGLIDFRLVGPSHKQLAYSGNNTWGSFGQFTSYHRLSGQIRKWSYLLHFNHRSSEGWRPNSSISGKDIFASIAYQPSETAKWTCEFTWMRYLAKQPGGLTDRQFNENPRYSNRDRNWFRINWQIYQLAYVKEFSTRTKFSWQLSGLNAKKDALGFRGSPINLNGNPILELDEQHPDGSYVNPRDLIRGTFRNIGSEARLLHRYTLKDRMQMVLLGAKFYQSWNQSIQGPGSLESDADFSFSTPRFPDYPNQSNFLFPNLNVALFAENTFQISDRWSLTPGLRFENIRTQSEGIYNEVVFDNAGNAISNDVLNEYRDLRRSFVIFGMGFSYRPSINQEFYFNLTQNYRSVTFSDLRVVNPSFQIDPNIRDESGFSIDLGQRSRYLGDRVTMDMSLFGMLYDNRIGLILNDRAERVRKNIGSAFITGLEALMKIQLMGKSEKRIHPKGLSMAVWCNWSGTHSVYLNSQESNVTGNRVEFVPVSIIRSGFDARFKNWSISFQTSHTGIQYTDAQNSETLAVGDLREGLIGIIPAYEISDFYVSYQYNYIKLGCGINNIFDSKYFTRRALGYPGPGIIAADPRSIFLSLGINF